MLAGSWRSQVETDCLLLLVRMLNREGRDEILYGGIKFKGG